jgi:shikimate kinase
MKIFLIGLPGCGKTTLGRQLAEKLSLPFLDLDSEIEKSEGKTVQEIFATKSENHFREIESSTLKTLCQKNNNFVMATGGGAPCFFSNMELMNQSGKTIFLDIPVMEIVSRLQTTNLEDRPLFSNLSSDQLKNKIELLRSQRIHFYKQAQTIVTSNSILADQIVSKIAKG